MKIVFAGTPSFAAFHLKLLIESNHDVVAVLTQPDRPSGRGQKLKASPVKLLAEENKLTTLQPKNLKNNSKLIEQIKQLDPDLILVVAYGLILPKEIINIPRFGCINVHASLLPRWRGAAPIEASILAGDPEGGITYMKMDEGLDTGPIMKQVACPIEFIENSFTLEKKYENLSNKELIKFLNDVDKGKAKSLKQVSSDATYANKIDKNQTQISWDYDGWWKIERMVRAFYPKYGAFTYLDNKRIKILMMGPSTTARRMGNEVSGEGYLRPGEIYVNAAGAFFVGCRREDWTLGEEEPETGLDRYTAIQVTILQMEGQKVLSSRDFIKKNGGWH